jgi:hypothetical protein
MGVAGLAGFPGLARAQNEVAMVNGKPSRLLLIMMNGGYAPMMTSAASFVNNSAAEMSFGFSVNEAAKPFEAIQLEGGGDGEVTIDTETWGNGVLGTKIYERFACIGAVGASNHNSAQHLWDGPEGGLPQALAAAMGGNSPIKAAAINGPAGSNTAKDVGGVSLEGVSSLESALATLNGAGNILPKEHRPVMGDAVRRTYNQVKDFGFNHRENLGSLLAGYQALSASYDAPPAEVSADEINGAYAGTGTLGGNLKIAEGLFRSGVSVVCVGEGGGTVWDTHDDNDGSRSRALFAAMTAGLSKFGERMLGRDDMNMTIVCMSEHSRIPLISNHGPHLSTIVISDNVYPGLSTGVTDRGGLIPDADALKPVQSWKAAVGEMVGLFGAANPFGAAPQHQKILKFR